MEMVTILTIHLYKDHTLYLRRNSLLSTYTIIFQAMKNDFKKALTSDYNKYGHILGKGLANIVISLLQSRLNIDGKEPKSQKVGLFDMQQW